MAQLIRLTGIEAEGRHGAVAEEREQPQRFVVDLELLVQTDRDELTATADYRDVAAAVREVITGESYSLVETLAEAVARRAAAVPGVRSCRVVVHKPGAASRMGIGDVSAEATASNVGPQP